MMVELDSQEKKTTSKYQTALIAGGAGLSALICAKVY